MTSELLDDLRARGLIHQVSAEPALRQLMDRERITGYVGFDPTADSLHVGSLLQILSLVRLQRAGHRPLVLVGGGTGLIGDPSGKEAERVMQGREQIERNVAGIRAQLSRFLDLGPAAGLLVDNIDWLGELRLIDFLRDIGKHFSVNQMVMRDSVRTRLERQDQGISYTEFSYMLLQAFDFLELHRRHGCRLQLGGSDQWGNILSGADLIRRLHQTEAFALTSPLITRADGRKFGKSEAGNVWLDPRRTTPYEFYQFWLNLDDGETPAYLRYFTLLPMDQIEAIERQQLAAPHERAAQRALAGEVTALVHGSEALARARRATGAFFGELDWRELSRQELDEALQSVPRTELPRAQLEGEAGSLLSVLASTPLYPSKGRARKDVEQGAISVNGQKQTDIGAQLKVGDLLAGRYLILRRGKKSYHVVECIG